MAGDWLKVETSTPDKPEIWSIAEQLGIDPDAVVGKLFRVWAWFDQQTENGNAPTVTKMLLDRKVGVIGFCDAVIESGWMTETDSLTLPNFDRHNGQTAKNRALTAKRVAKHKKGNADTVTPSVNNALPREEKRREEKNINNSPAKPDYHDDDLLFAEKMFNSIVSQQPTFKKPNLKSWAKTIRLMRERDGRNYQDMEKVFVWARRDNFWQGNILSANKFREKYDTLTAQMSRAPQAAGKTEKQQQRAEITSALMDIHNTDW